ncbi:MAG: xanthine dehydrogenase subunit D [Solirubrobacterales bacterium]
MTVKAPGKADRAVIGDSPLRPDGTDKVKGEFAYASDLWADRMLWGVTLRSPHPYARIRSIEIAQALATPGVFAVLTHEDVPGSKVYGLEVPDQPVLAWDVVRYQGEPVAILAADHPETARRAAKLVAVDYEVLEPLVDMDKALITEEPRLHPGGNVLKHIRVEHGDIDVGREEADVVIRRDYEVGMQDQAFLGPESGLAIPGEDGGVDLHVATQWLHADRRQMAASLDLPPEKVRLTLAGVGGAFGGREDLSMQIHSCMLALRLNRPVKMMYSREESFFGHVHRHPARLSYEHGATRHGRLVYVKANIRFDGGAYASSSQAVCVNAASTAAGPYECPHAEIDSSIAYTNNPPCGAMRGFGAVQAAFAYEAQMDELAAALDLDPVELRRRNAMDHSTELPTGQLIDAPAPVDDLLRRLNEMPLPPDPEPGVARDLRELPGGVSNTTHGEGVKRGVGYAIGFKNVGFSGGFDDYSTARIKVFVVDGEPAVEVHTACCEVGQGGITVQAQIARTELGVEKVVMRQPDTQVGNAGSSSASRQTWITGGAVKVACEAVRVAILGRAVERLGAQAESLRLADGAVVGESGAHVISLVDLLGEDPIEETREYRPRRTEPLGEKGQGDAHLAFAYAAHRAVVDVDCELGLVRVVEVATTQDVGRALNPDSVVAQIQGGIAQGVGLAVMEEIQVKDGLVRNPSFTDYLIPTMLDMPTVRAEILELPQPHAPYGLNGVGEPPTIASTPAVVAAIRAATGRPLRRVPVTPDAIVGALEQG